MEIWPKIEISQIQDGGRTPYWKSFFWQYLSAILANLCKFRYGDEESQADIGHLTKVAIFPNSRWRTAAILKIALYPYLSRNYPISSKFWYADANLHSEDGYLTKRNSKFIKFKSDYPINAKFCKIKQNRVLTRVTWPKYQISKIQDGGRPPFWK